MFVTHPSYYSYDPMLVTTFWLYDFRCEIGNNMCYKWKVSPKADRHTKTMQHFTFRYIDNGRQISLTLKSSYSLAEGGKIVLRTLTPT